MIAVIGIDEAVVARIGETAALELAVAEVRKRLGGLPVEHVETVPGSGPWRQYRFRYPERGA